MKKNTIIIKGKNLEKFLNQIDSTPHLERLSVEDLEEQLSKEFDINVIQKEIKSLGEENLKDLFDKLHALSDDELQETLRTCPTIREVWHKHFVNWTFGHES
jgi:hypothetical protein